MTFARKARGHFVTLIEICMSLIECISGHPVAVMCFLGSVVNQMFVSLFLEPIIDTFNKR